MHYIWIWVSEVILFFNLVFQGSRYRPFKWVIFQKSLYRLILVLVLIRYRNLSFEVQRSKHFYFKDLLKSDKRFEISLKNEILQETKSEKHFNARLLSDCNCKQQFPNELKIVMRIESVVAHMSNAKVAWKGRIVDAYCWVNSDGKGDFYKMKRGVQKIPSWPAHLPPIALFIIM